MTRLTQHVGQRSSGLALLGVSTIVLAAAGETMWHAHAATSEGSWAAPTVGVAEAMANLSAVAAEEEVNTMTASIFRPFVFVELPLPAGYTLVPDPGVHMNDDGVVVATMNDGSDNYGFIWYDEAYVNGWQGPLEASSTEIVLDDAGLAGINDELEICGTRENSPDKAFFLELTSAYAGTYTEIGSGYASDVNESGVVVGTSVSGAPVGWSSMAGSPFVLPPLAYAVGTAAHGVESGGGYAPIIVGQSEDADFDVQAVAWYNSSGWQVQSLSNVSDPDFATAVDINDDLHIIGAIMDDLTAADDTVLWVYNSGWTGKILDIATPFFPEAINDEALPEIVGEKYLWKATGLTANPVTGVLMNLQDLMLTRLDVYQIRCTDINNSGEIVGVAQLEDAQGEWIAFKLVPYDANNNLQPDFREIIANPSLDDNDNWLIDDYEQIRVGLHAAGYGSGPAHSIPNAQIVRLGMHLLLLPNDSLPNGEYALNEVVDPQETPSCDFREDMERWTRGGSWQREVVIWMRSTLEGQQYSDYDFLPASLTQENDILADLREFGYQYARCIDWVQFGNEVFGGAGQYYFRNGELSSGSGPFRDLSQAQKEEAIELILEWLDKQMQAVREGSAWAGRPLRLIAPGVVHENVQNGWEAGNSQDPPSHQGYPGFYLTEQMTRWVNERQMYFDMHTHYFAPADGVEAAEKLRGIGDWSDTPWEVPDFAVALEWGPAVDPDWDSYLTFETAYVEQFRDDGIGDCEDDPGMDWDEFVVAWRQGQFGIQATDFGMDDVLAGLRDSGFTVACYGPVFQRNGSPAFDFDMAALRASRVCSEWLNTARTDPVDTYLRDEFYSVTENGGYFISGFAPHPVACPQCE